MDEEALGQHLQRRQAVPHPLLRLVVHFWCFSGADCSTDTDEYMYMYQAPVLRALRCGACNGSSATANHTAACEAALSPKTQPVHMALSGPQAF
jgi:hypothetical protein|mmetsp:Transcript_58424/g.96950  ORF Transcript_58424/g.96950 Transcript_58424/m.96950 type:complete len:94 (-) Transcript_58424:847-1128(-)